MIDVIEAFTKDLHGTDAYFTGNIIKYMLRWNKKGGTEDLEKARWYLNRMIRNKKTELEVAEFGEFLSSHGFDDYQKELLCHGLEVLRNESENDDE